MRPPARRRATSAVAGSVAAPWWRVEPRRARAARTSLTAAASPGVTPLWGGGDVLAGSAQADLSGTHRQHKVYGPSSGRCQGKGGMP